MAIRPPPVFLQRYVGDRQNVRIEAAADALVHVAKEPKRNKNARANDDRNDEKPSIDAGAFRRTPAGLPKRHLNEAPGEIGQNQRREREAEQQQRRRRIQAANPGKGEQGMVPQISAVANQPQPDESSG